MLTILLFQGQAVGVVLTILLFQGQAVGVVLTVLLFQGSAGSGCCADCILLFQRSAGSGCCADCILLFQGQAGRQCVEVSQSPQQDCKQQITVLASGGDVDRWRDIGLTQGLTDDSDIAVFLITL